jgi:molybdopterin-guanine dinucleotide biosynthesis protein A
MTATSASASASLVVGIFVGGRGSRLGGVAKGLLKAPDSDTTLVERLLQQLTRAAPGAEIVLVGSAEPYASLGLPSIADEPSGIGPLGGLLGLLSYAGQRGAPTALVLACDLPRLDAAIITRLLNDCPEAHALVAEQVGVRNPLIARYATEPTLLAARHVLQSGQRSLQAVLELLQPHVACLRLSAAETALLGDWDEPSDMHADRPK